MFFLQSPSNRCPLTAAVCFSACTPGKAASLAYDFLIVGGGIAGASAAYALAARGSVLLLEAEDSTGYHATGRSAALFTRNYGGEVVRRINAASAGFFRAPPEGFCPTPLLTPRGCLTVADAASVSDLETLLAMSEPGEDVVPIGADTACAMVPFLRPDRVSHAVYEENVADIDVATLQLSYLKGARARGAQVLTKHAITALTHGVAGWSVQAAGDSFVATHVINAAGAWADQVGALAGATPIGLVPKRRSAIVIDAPPGIDCSTLPALDFAGSDAYLKPEGGRLMASPGDATPMEPHDAWPDDMDIAVLVDWIQRETTLKIESIRHSWAGLRSFVADESPVVGFDPQVPHFFWLAGQGGYGIMMAPALAALTADLICEGKPGPASAQFSDELSPGRLQ